MSTIMNRGPLPLTLEDRTSLNTDTDYDDMYDRMFYRVVRNPGHSSTLIYEMPIRSSRHRRTLPLDREPVAHLEFLPDESLGNISFMKAPHQSTMPMSWYLKKTTIFGSSLSRKFVGSDGREYKWSSKTVSGQEWTCTTADNYIVAHYDLKPSNVRTYDVSGNNLVIYEPFAHLALEIICSFTIMRHIALHSLR